MPFFCHSTAAAQAKKLKAGLHLDTRDGVLKEGDSGPAVVVGKPAESLLVEAIHFTGDTKMPPKGKLPSAVIADLEKWVAMGLTNARTATSGRKQIGMAVEDGSKFWEFKPVVATTPPAVKGEWAKTDIDRYILAGMQAKNLAPAQPA